MERIPKGIPRAVLSRTGECDHAKGGVDPTVEADSPVLSRLSGPGHEVRPRNLAPVARALRGGLRSGARSHGGNHRRRPHVLGSLRANRLYRFPANRVRPGHRVHLWRGPCSGDAFDQVQEPEAAPVEPEPELASVPEMVLLPSKNPTAPQMPDKASLLQRIRRRSQTNGTSRLDAVE